MNICKYVFTYMKGKPKTREFPIREGGKNEEQTAWMLEPCECLINL